MRARRGMGERRGKDSDRYRLANFTEAQPLFRCLARLGRGKVIPVSVLSLTTPGHRERCAVASELVSDQSVLLGQLEPHKAACSVGNLIVNENDLQFWTAARQTHENIVSGRPALRMATPPGPGDVHSTRR